MHHYSTQLANTISAISENKEPKLLTQAQKEDQCSQSTSHTTRVL